MRINGHKLVLTWTTHEDGDLVWSICVTCVVGLMWLVCFMDTLHMALHEKVLNEHSLMKLSTNSTFVDVLCMYTILCKHSNRTEHIVFLMYNLNRY